MMKITSQSLVKWMLNLLITIMTKIWNRQARGVQIQIFKPEGALSHSICLCLLNTYQIVELGTTKNKVPCYTTVFGQVPLFVPQCTRILLLKSEEYTWILDTCMLTTCHQNFKQNWQNTDLFFTKYFSFLPLDSVLHLETENSVQKLSWIWELWLNVFQFFQYQVSSQICGNSVNQVE